MREQDGPADIPGVYDGSSAWFRTRNGGGGPYRRTYVSVSMETMASDDFAGEAAVQRTKTHEQGGSWGRQRRGGLPSRRVGGRIARDLRKETQPDTSAWGENSADAASCWDAMADSVLERKTEREAERKACEQPTSADHDQYQGLNVVQGVFSLDEVENGMMSVRAETAAHQQPYEQDRWAQDWQSDASNVKVWSLQALEQQMFREARRSPPAKKGADFSASDTARTMAAPASTVAASNATQRQWLPPAGRVHEGKGAYRMIALDQSLLQAPRVAEALAGAREPLTRSARAGARAGSWTSPGDCQEGKTAGNRRPPVTTPAVSRRQLAGVACGLMQSSDAGASRPARTGKLAGAAQVALQPSASTPAAAPAGAADASLTSLAAGANLASASAGLHLSNAARLARNATATPSNPWGTGASIPWTRTDPTKGHGDRAPLTAILQPHVVSQYDATQEDSDNFPSLSAACKPTGMEAGSKPPHARPSVTKRGVIGVRAFGKQQQHREAEGTSSGGKQHDLLATRRREEPPRNGGKWAQVASAEASGAGRGKVWQASAPSCSLSR